MLAALCAEFERRFGAPPSLAVRAPGRVNLIGEHTDYNEGLVLPCAIDRDTVVVAAPRSDGRVRVFSTEQGELAEFEAAAPQRLGSWVDYIQGPFAAFAERGLQAGGIDLAVASQVPRESGLSSSAALGVAVALACERAHGLGLSMLEIGRVAHRGENSFVGVGCGIMDPFASALGRRDHALRIDCRSGVVTPVALADGRVRLLIAQSGVERALARGGYRERVAECRAALEAACAADIAPPGAQALRDLGTSDLPALSRTLEPRLFRRARHVITENVRVEAFCAALAQADPAAGGALLREAQRSLRDDFEVSVPELDALCEVADAQPGVYGSRLTGAGFGGCTVHLVAPESEEAAAEAIASGFEARFGRRAPVLRVRPAEGAGSLALDSDR